MSCAITTRRQFGTRPLAVAMALTVVLVLSLSAAESQRSTNGPRGKPIRPPASRLTNSLPPDVAASGVLTLPGGVVITNLPQEFLPRTTNIIRLPTRAARKFEPLGYSSTSFTVLARFFVKLPESGPGTTLTPSARWDAVRQQIPEDVLAMDGKKVALAGFTLPLVIANGRATEFLLLRTQSACCFGMVPRVNELVIVKMAPPGMVPLLDTPVVAAGTLTLKWIGEGGQLTAIYEMQADKVERASSH